MKSIRKLSFLLPLALCLSFLTLLRAAAVAPKAAVGPNAAITPYAPADPRAAAALIEKACSTSEYKDLCIQSLTADQASKETSDLKGLVLLAIRLAGANGSDTSAYVKKLVDTKNSTDPVIQQCLEDCSEHYLSATEQLDDSIAALVAGADKDVKTWLEAAITDVESCEDGFKQFPGKQSVITAKNEIFRKLCSNALAINDVWSKEK